MRHMLGNLSPNYFERTKRYMMLRASQQGTDLTVSDTPPLSLPNSLGKPLKAWSVDLLPYQEGSGDPSPTNVRPIHGTDKLNLFVEESYDPSATPKAVVTFPALGKNLLNMAVGTHNAWSFVNIPNNLKPNTQYTFSIQGTTSYTYALYLGNSEQSTRALSSAITAGGSSTFTTPDDMSTEPLLAVAGTTSGAGNEDLADVKPQVELGATKTSYEAYTNVVYGGELTVNEDGSGSIVINHAIKRVSSFSGTFGNTPNGYAAYVAVVNGNRGKTLILMCNLFKYSSDSYDRMPTYSYMGGSGVNTTWTFILPSTVTNITEANQWIADNGGYIDFTYGLDTPLTYTLTTPTIPTPTGTATTWATAEDGTVDSMEVTYVGKA